MQPKETKYTLDGGILFFLPVLLPIGFSKKNIKQI